MELENVKLTAKCFLKVSKNGKPYHQVEIYCKDNLIAQTFLNDTSVSLIKLLTSSNTVNNTVNETIPVDEGQAYLS